MVHETFSIKGLEVDPLAIVDLVLDSASIILNACVANEWSLLLYVAVPCAKVELSLRRLCYIRRAWTEGSSLNLHLFLFAFKGPIKMRGNRSFQNILQTISRHSIRKTLTFSGACMVQIHSWRALWFDCAL